MPEIQNSPETGSTTTSSPSVSVPQAVLQHECSRCGNTIREEDTRIQLGENYYCSDCLDSEEECFSCGDSFLVEDLMVDSSGDIVCVNCYRQEVIPEVETMELQSKTSGEFIKTSRTFGVELETIGTKLRYNKFIAQMPVGYRTHRDGSLRGSRGLSTCVEIVSNVLRGLAGEKYLAKLAEVANKTKLQVNNSCGFHVHIGAEDLLAKEEVFLLQGENFSPRIIEILKNKKGTESFQFFVIRKYFYEKVKEELSTFVESPVLLSVQRFNSMLERYKVHYPIVFSETDERITYALSELTPLGSSSKSELTKENLGLVFVLKKTGKFSDVIALNNLYAVYDSVFSGIVNETRLGNHYCAHVVPIAPDKTEKIASMNELLTSVQKSQSSGIYYGEGSRYRGLNLYSLLKHGTIEIRYHQGTLDEKEIIYWTSLHTHILDYVMSRGDIFSTKAEIIGNKLSSTVSKAKTLFKLLDLPEKVSSFYLERLKTAEEKDSIFLSREHNIRFNN